MIAVADIDATGWTVIIGAVFLGLTQLVREVLAYLRERRVTGKIEQVVVKADQAAVKVVKAEETMRETNEATTAKLEEIKTSTDKTLQRADGALTAQMLMVAETTKAKAEITGDSVDITAAKAAKEALEKQEVQSKSVNGTTHSVDIKDVHADVKEIIKE